MSFSEWDVSTGTGVIASAVQDIDYHADWARNTVQPPFSIPRLGSVPVTVTVLNCITFSFCSIVTLLHTLVPDGRDYISSFFKIYFY